MHWLIVLGIIAYVLYALTRKSGGKKSSGSSPTAGRSSGRDANFLPPIPKGFQIFAARLSVAGIEHNREDALSFANGANQALVLEREPNNTHDTNAIKVIGDSRGIRRCIGYVPKEVAEQIVGSGLADVVRSRLERIWCNDNGFVDVTFQILGPKDKKAKYEEFLNNKPADAWQKECLKFFGLPVSKGLTTGQAEQLIATHRAKLETEDKTQLDEWDAYEEICDQFDDAEFRTEFEIKKVSRTTLKEALDALKLEGNTLQYLAISIDMVVDKVIVLKPEVARK